MVCGCQLTDAFQVKTGVRQGCLLSPFLFLPASDWVLKTSKAQKGNGIQWTQLDDLDFADVLALLSHTQRQIQEKTSTVAESSVCLGLKIHRGKSKVLKNNPSVSTTPITLEGDGIEDVTSFTNLGSTVDKQRGEGGGGRTDADVQVRTGREREQPSSK